MILPLWSRPFLPFGSGESNSNDAWHARPIGGYDVLIAGHARSRGLIVVTGNLGELTRVVGLRCEDWLTEN